MKRIFSGIQPSGKLHIGNYLGAIKNWVELESEFESIFCIVDLHAITVPQDPEELRKRITETAKAYLALGINPEKSAMFIQSHIPEHAELAWILNTIARMSDLFRMTQFKDKAQKEGQENSGVGLFDYPVLMAADILLYDTDVVPVGQDQIQHIELTRTLARRFNKKYENETLKVPKYFVKEETKLIMGLDDPSKKMSKSATSEYNYIGLLDDVDLIKRKIKKAVTGSGSEVKYSDDEPALKNLINIFSAFSGKKPEEIVSEYQGKGYADFKEGLTKAVLDFIIPFQERFNAIDDKKVLDILQEGAEKVRPLAEKKIKEVKERVGFVGN